MTMMNAPEFFYKHAGWSFQPETETPEQGRRRCAEDMARDELRGREHGISFRWEDDWSIGSHVEEFDCYDEPPTTCRTCTAFTRDGVPVASLSCIDDATDDYRRVIEAELVSEALANLASA